MTLKEKFTERLYNQSHDDIECLKIRFENIDKVLNSQVKIADEFAIGFAEWVRKETYYEHLTKEFIYKRNVYESEKELLEIYKKEKRL
jgi:hypothetical protein